MLGEAHERFVPASFVRLGVVRLIALLLVAWSVLGARTAHAREAGLASTLFLGRTPPSCNSCHSGGTAPTVTLTADDTTLNAGQQITLTVTVTSVNGNPGRAGFNLRSSQQGTFAVGGSASASTRTITGTNNWLEATHSSPKLGEPVTFTTLWTPGASASGPVTFTVWGNAVNANGATGGDQAASTTLAVTVGACTPVTWYRDADGDAYGAASSGTASACTAPAGYVVSATDCNDGSNLVHPGAAEICNGADDDCAGGVDNGLTFSTYYRDVDDDGWGSATSGTLQACTLPVDHVGNNGDCADDDAGVHPGAAEACNGVDDDCDSDVDEAPQCGTGGSAGTGGALGGAGGSSGAGGTAGGGAPANGGVAGVVGGAGTAGGVGAAGAGGVPGVGGASGGEEAGAAGEGDAGDGGEAGATSPEPGGRGGAGGDGGGATSAGGTGATSGKPGVAGAMPTGGAGAAGASNGGAARGGSGPAGSGAGGAASDAGCGCRLVGTRDPSGVPQALALVVLAAGIYRRRVRRAS
jgi:hypothetical protein